MKALTHVALRTDTLTLPTQENIVNQRVVLSQMVEPKVKSTLVNEAFKFLFELVHPVHCKKTLERGVVHWVWNVGQGVECQKLRGFRELRSSIVEVLFELSLLDLESILGVFAEALVVVRVVNEDHKVNVQVKLKFFCLEVLL